MTQNCIESGEKPLTGHSLSRVFDEIMGNLAHILRTRVISSLNALKSTCGERHHGILSACSELKFRSRHDLNLNDETP